MGVRFYIFLQKKRNMGKKKNCFEIVNFIVCLMAIVLSIIAICRTCCRTVELDFDYLGIIVGVLAILVTFLVGWNIYSAIDAKEKIKFYQDEIDRLKTLQEEQMKAFEKKSYKIQGDLYITTVSLAEKINTPSALSLYTDMVLNMVLSIDSLSRAESFAFADIKLKHYCIIIKSDLDMFKKNIENETKKGILEHLFEIPNKGKMKDFKEFKEIILMLCS